MKTKKMLYIIFVIFFVVLLLAVLTGVVFANVREQNHDLNPGDTVVQYQNGIKVLVIGPNGAELQYFSGKKVPGVLLRENQKATLLNGKFKVFRIGLGSENQCIFQRC